MLSETFIYRGHVYRGLHKNTGSYCCHLGVGVGTSVDVFVTLQNFTTKFLM